MDHQLHALLCHSHSKELHRPHCGVPLTAWAAHTSAGQEHRMMGRDSASPMGLPDETGAEKSHQHRKAPQIT